MPEDLLTYENEMTCNPLHSKLYDIERFSEASVHMMPLKTNAFYVKEMDKIQYETESEDEEGPADTKDSRLKEEKITMPSKATTSPNQVGSMGTIAKLQAKQKEKAARMKLAME